MDVQTIVRTQGSGNQGVKMGIAFITINPSDSLATFFFFLLACLQLDSPGLGVLVSKRITGGKCFHQGM